MKEKINQENLDGGMTKPKMFKVLNKKLKRDNSPPEINKNKKKKLFVLQRIIPNSNENNYNENIINNKNINENNNNLIKNNNQALIIIKNKVEEINKNEINQKNIINNEINNNINNKKINPNDIYVQQNNIDNQNNNNNNKSNNNENKISEIGDYICYTQNQIGSGSFGQVLYGIHKHSSLEVAVKIINSETSQDSIQKELKYTKQLQTIKGFPTIYSHCIYDKNNIFIESLLGPSLDKLFTFCGKKFPLKTVCILGKEIIKRLESMHDKGILHRDLKPNNLTWGNFNSSYNNILDNNSNNNVNNILDINTIFLIDFGLSCSYLEGYSGAKHYKIKNNLNFIGTLRYASLNSHKGIRQSRRDDLESMIYILIYFLKGELPWQNVKAKNKEERYKIIFEKKSAVSVESLCEGIPQEFSELLNYIKKMDFEEKPNYFQFYSFFHNIIEKISRENIPESNYNYIWETLLIDNINKYNESKDENIKEKIEKYLFRGYPINLQNYINYIINNNNPKK